MKQSSHIDYSELERVDPEDLAPATYHGSRTIWGLSPRKDRTDHGLRQNRHQQQLEEHHN